MKNKPEKQLFQERRFTIKKSVKFLRQRTNGKAYTEASTEVTFSARYNII